MTDFDELARAWQRETETMHLLTGRMQAYLDRADVNRAGALLAPLKRTLWFEIVMNAIGLLLLGSFAYGERAETAFVLSAALLMAVLIGLLQSAVRALVLSDSIEADLPIATAQKRIESLRILRLRMQWFIVIASPLLWAPLFIVGMKALFGIDVFAEFSPLWLWGNLALGALIVGGALMLVRNAAAAGRAPAYLRAIGEALTGRSLRRAQQALANVERFTRDDHALEGT